MSTVTVETASVHPNEPAASASSNRRLLWTAVVVCCVVEALAAYVFRLWHPHPFTWGGDFQAEALGPLRTLAHGHVLTFLKTGPAYLGGVVAEAVLVVPGIWLGAGDGLLYYLAVIPAVIAAPLLAGWSIYRRGTLPRFRDLPLALVVLNPVTLSCLGFGHPEDILAACLILGAVLEGCRGATRTSVVLIALAVAVQPFAVVVAPVVWAVSPNARRTCILSVVAAAVFWLPLIVLHEISLGANDVPGFVGAGVGQIFYPEQFLYWLGPNSWIVGEAHLLIPLATTVLTGLWWRRRKLDSAADTTTEALWLLALLLLIRASFDPWDNSYYHLPFLMVLMALDARSKRRLPLLSAVASAVAFILVPLNANAATADPSRVAAHYSLVVGPALLLLASRVYAPQHWRSLRGAWARSHRIWSAT